MATVLRMRSVSWIAHFGHETDMHPVDLIWDSSMLVRQKFKFNGVPVNPLFFQGSQNKSAGQRQNQMKDSNGWEIISTYSTKEAVDDGFLVKVESKASKEVGIKFPVYITRAAWDKYVEVPKGMEQLQNLSGRLWDVLYMFAFHARNVSSNFLQYDFISYLPDEGNWEPNEKLETPENRLNRLVTLKAVIQAQDFNDPSPAIFIMKPNED
jgi:hypothetical protein